MANQLVLRRLLEACRTHEGDGAEEAMHRLSEEFVAEAGKNHLLLDAACAELPNLPAHGAAWLGVQLGVCAETHQTAARTINPLLNLFMGWLERLPQPAGAYDPDDEEASPLATTPEQDELLDAILLVAPSIIVHLAQVPMRRRALAQDQAFMQRLAQVESCSNAISWILDVLRRRSGSLIVLHPTSRKGLQVRYENVLNCFHLFSLLQCAIGRRIEGGQEPNEVTRAAARGEISGHFIDKGWWHYGDARIARPELLASIWGENSVSEIPVINGSQVLLLWPQLPSSRSWDSSYFDVALAAFVPDVQVERELSSDEVNGWLKRLGIDSGASTPPPTAGEPQMRRSWWRFWRRPAATADSGQP